MAHLSSFCLTKILGISPKMWSWAICLSLQGDGGCLCLGLEVGQGCDEFPGIACSLGKYSIPHLPALSCRALGEPELCWGGAEGVGVSQGKNQRARIPAREGIPIFVCSVLSLGHLSLNKLPSFNLFGDNHSP